MGVVALDLDGTLEGSRSDMVASVLRVRSALGLSEGLAHEFRPHVNRGMDHLYRTCFSDYLEGRGEAAYEEVKARYVASYGEHIAVETQLYSGIADALAALTAEHKLALVTNKPEALSRKLLDALAVSEHFDVVIGGDTCGRSKPHPDPLAEAIRLCGGGAAINIIFLIVELPTLDL